MLPSSIVLALLATPFASGKSIERQNARVSLFLLPAFLYYRDMQPVHLLVIAAGITLIIIFVGGGKSTDNDKPQSTTYSNATGPDGVPGAQSFQTSAPFYPSPWMTGAGDWASAYEQARAFVSQLTLLEKVNLTTGVG
jgi:hypothetical protein